MRPFASEDIDALHRLWVDPQMRKYLWDDEIITREQVVAVVDSSIESFETYGFGFWRISLKEDPILIGFCGLRHFRDDQSQPYNPAEGTDAAQVEILYGIASEHWNKGLASEAANAVLGFGFEQVGLEKIYAGADPPNSASIRVMEKLGLIFDRFTRVNSVDAIYYGVLRGDFNG